MYAYARSNCTHQICYKSRIYPSPKYFAGSTHSLSNRGDSYSLHLCSIKFPKIWHKCLIDFLICIKHQSPLLLRQAWIQLKCFGEMMDSTFVANLVGAIGPCICIKLLYWLRLGDEHPLWIYTWPKQKQICLPNLIHCLFCFLLTV